MDSPVNAAEGRRLLMMIGCLYLVQGLPVGLAFQAYPVLLRDGGASLDLIALAPLASLPWVFKFFWACVVENHWIRPLGRRKSWILPMQTLLALSLAGMALFAFTAGNAPALLILVAIASLVSATQDIATDGLASERLYGTGLAHINTLQVAGFMTGMLMGGPGAMLGIATVAARAGYVVALSIGFVVALLLMALVLRLRKSSRQPDSHTASASSIAS